MNSTVLMQGLMGAYVIIMVVSLLERNYPRALYWFAAALLTASVLWGTK